MIFVTYSFLYAIALLQLRSYEATPVARKRLPSLDGAKAPDYEPSL